MTEKLLQQRRRIKVEEPNTHLNVCKTQCKNCLFGKSPHIPWEPFGREKIEKIVKADDQPFTCHNFQNAQCNGYWHEYGKNQWFGRYAKMIDKIRWIDQPRENTGLA